jgi:uncharacterized protein affecting Mg2+/Co2+ transport
LRQELVKSGESTASVASPEVLQFLRDGHNISTCTSISEEGGLHLDVVSGFVHHASSNDQYTFAYNMRFTNLSNRRLRILARQYDFCDASGAISSQVKVEQPEAAGVVGFTPLLEPGVSFVFGSGAAMKTPKGSVTGKFLVMVEPELRAEEMKMHQEMEKADLFLRFAYLKGLETEQFHMTFNELRFDKDVPCVSSLPHG